MLKNGKLYFDMLKFSKKVFPYNNQFFELPVGFELEISKLIILKFINRFQENTFIFISYGYLITRYCNEVFISRIDFI